MNCAIELCSFFECFAGDNKYIDNKTFTFGDVDYHFTLINSAPLSSLKKRDKDHHHIPKNYRKLIKHREIGKRTVEILLSHHREDWFDESTIDTLRDFISLSVSIAFFGHEHNNKEYEINNDGNSLIVMQGGELKSKDKDVIDGKFSILEFDDKEMECTVGFYTYNYVNSSVTYEEKGPKRKVTCFEQFKLNDDFAKEHFSSPLRYKTGSIDDIFVMPALYQDGNAKIRKLDEFITRAKANQKIFIDGNAKTGKTLLLKKAFLELKKDYVPVYLDCTSDVSPIIANFVERSFIKQYEDGPRKYKEYNALPKEKKVFLIDNMNRIRNDDILEKIIKYTEDNGSIVIGTFTKSFVPEKRLKEESFFGIKNTFSLVGFTYSERRQFASNICKVMNVPYKDYEKVINLYESTIITSKILDFTDPEYAMMLIEEIINSGSYVEREKSSAFSIVFTDSINNSFKKAGCGNRLDDCFYITSWLAWKLWSKGDAAEFTEDFAMDAYKECKSHYGTIVVTFTQYFNYLRDSQIVIEYSQETFRFRKATHFSYFVGVQIASFYKDNRKDDVEKLLSNINFGNNSDILLFVSYELKEKSVFSSIKNTIDNSFLEFEPISLNKNNNRILKEINGEMVEPTNKMVNKDEYIETKDNEEKKVIGNSLGKPKDTTKNKNSSGNNIIKMIEILSKAMSGFGNLFVKEERTEYIRSIIDVTLRLVQCFFTITDDDYKKFEKIFNKTKEKIINELSKDKTYSDILDDFKGLTLVGILYKYLINVVQALEYTISDWMTSSISLNFIDKLDDNDYIDCFIKLSSYVHMGNFEKFKNQLSKAYSISNGNILLRLLFLPSVNMYIVKNFVGKEQLKMISDITEIPLKHLEDMVPKSQLYYKK